MVAREDGPGDQRLVAYVRGATRPGPPVEELRELPAGAGCRRTWCPPTFVAARGAAAHPQRQGGPQGAARARPDRSALGVAYAAPRTSAEEMLTGLWAELLGWTASASTTTSSQLGGHSLLATQLASRVRHAFGVELPLRALFESPTPAGLAAQLAQAGAAASLAAGRAGGPRRGRSRFRSPRRRCGSCTSSTPPARPTTSRARSRWGGTSTPRWSSGRCSTSSGGTRCCARAIRLPAALPRALIHDAVPVPVPLVDLSGEADPDARATALAAALGAERFDLARDALIRTRLYRLGRGSPRPRPVPAPHDHRRLVVGALLRRAPPHLPRAGAG